jgi:hypothetical protein
VIKILPTLFVLLVPNTEVTTFLKGDLFLSSDTDSISSYSGSSHERSSTREPIKTGFMP